ncbi:MAG TPA: sigma-70 family RNA polymerase sigma factor [Longimicrobium sp.]|nr:sigma-70 family RNA polymerase sigma factor [Longimicrobium sp.]
MALAELARRAGRGDRAALNQLLTAVQDAVHGYLSRRLAGAPDGYDQAGDLRQVVLLRAADAVPRCHFEDDRRLMAWVLTIARRVLIDHVRSERARREVLPWQRLDTLAADPPLDGWQNVTAPDLWLDEDPPLDAWESAASADASDPLAAAVAGIVAALPEATRELLRLRVQLGCTWREVAQVLKTTEAGAKRRYQRAQVSLRARFRAVVCAMSPSERARLPAWAAALAGPC